MDTLGTMSPLATVHNSGNLFQSSICSLLLPVHNEEVSVRGELTKCRNYTKKRKTVIKNCDIKNINIF